MDREKKNMNVVTTIIPLNAAARCAFSRPKISLVFSTITFLTFAT